MLKIGDKIFIAQFGSGIVKEIKKMIFGIREEEYMEIFLFFDEMNLYIPSSRIDNYEIRKILSKQEMLTCLNVIEEISKNVERNWNRRYRINRKKINSLNMYNICEVMRDLYYLKKNSMLPQGEEKVLQRVEGLVVSEVMLIFNLNKKDANDKIKAKLSNMN